MLEEYQICESIRACNSLAIVLGPSNDFSIIADENYCGETVNGQDIKSTSRSERPISKLSTIVEIPGYGFFGFSFGLKDSKR